MMAGFATSKPRILESSLLSYDGVEVVTRKNENPILTISTSSLFFHSNKVARSEMRGCCFQDGLRRP